MTYGRLFVLNREKNKGKHTRWLCRCFCGNKIIVNGDDLNSGHTKSCGCLKKEIVISRFTTHGMTKTRQFFIWLNLKRRCLEKTNNRYKLYGGRGITYDPKWETFEGFWEDMKEGYKDDLTLDRIDNNGNYCKENCKWATRKEQANNTSRNHHLTYKGEKKTIAQWAREYNISYKVFWSKLKKANWSIKRALNK